MDAQTRDVLIKALTKLRDYRDVCAEEGFPILYRSINKVCREVEAELKREHKPPVVDHSGTLEIFNDSGEVMPLDELHRQIYTKALMRHSCATKVAKQLGISRSMLYRRMGMHNIDRKTLR